MSPTRKLPLLFLLLLSPLLASADDLDDIIERGTLRVGVSVFAPWTVQTPSGELIGFEVDLTKKMARDMGVETDFRVLAWDQLIPALEKGEIDIIAAGMSITPARALRVNFSTAVAEEGISIAANRNQTRGIDSIRELNDPKIKIGIVPETLGGDVARRLFNEATLVEFPDSAAVEEALLSGDVVIYVSSDTESHYLSMVHPRRIDAPLSEPLVGSVNAFAVAKGNQEWLNYVNAWVAAREADQTLSTAHRYWFRSLDWRKQLEE